MKKFLTVLLASFMLVMAVAPAALADGTPSVVATVLSAPESISLGDKVPYDKKSISLVDDLSKEGYQMSNVTISSGILRYAMEVSASEQYHFKINEKYYRLVGKGTSFELGRTYIFLFAFNLEKSAEKTYQETYNEMTIQVNGTDVKNQSCLFSTYVVVAIVKTYTITATFEATVKDIPKSLAQDETVPETKVLNAVEDLSNEGYKTSIGQSLVCCSFLEQVPEGTSGSFEIDNKYYIQKNESTTFEKGKTYAYSIQVMCDNLTQDVYDRMTLNVNEGSVKEKSAYFDSDHLTFAIIKLYQCDGPEPVPSTGDNTPIVLTAGLLLLSGIALVALKKRTAR